MAGHTPHTWTGGNPLAAGERRLFSAGPQFDCLGNAYALVATDEFRLERVGVGFSPFQRVGNKTSRRGLLCRSAVDGQEGACRHNDTDHRAAGPGLFFGREKRRFGPKQAQGGQNEGGDNEKAHNAFLSKMRSFL
jgi:hypothetical protein